MTLPNNYSHGLINRDETIPNEQVRKGMTSVFLAAHPNGRLTLNLSLSLVQHQIGWFAFSPSSGWIGLAQDERPRCTNSWERMRSSFWVHTKSLLLAYSLTNLLQVPKITHLPRRGNVAWNESYGDLFKSQPRPSQISFYLFVFGLLQHQHFTHSTPFISSKKVPILVHCIMYIIVYCKC